MEHRDGNERVEAVDIIRGFVMVIMILDHTRDFFHINALTQNPTDLSTTTFALFFTRWITHLCAPTFVFLSGVSAFLSFRKKKDLKSVQSLLLKRGIWLLILEFTLINFGVWFDLHFSNFLFAVIGAISVGFIILSALMRLGAQLIGFMGVSIIILHNVVPLLSLGPALNALFLLSVFPIGKSLLIIGYPIIPWTGIMLAGYGAGIYFNQNTTARNIFFKRSGIILLSSFVLLRLFNKYGDPVLWDNSGNFQNSILSFINVSKYPPSLMYTTLMLGWMFLLLYSVDKWNRKVKATLKVYGRVPLFFFIVHWYILHPLLFMLLLAQGFSIKQFVFGFNFGRPETVSGVSLVWVYLIWILVTLSLYPICLWYGKYKALHPKKAWLKYL